MMVWTCGQLAELHRTQFPTEGLLGDRHLERVVEPLAQIDNPPAHYAMDRRGRSALDDRGECGAMLTVQP